MPEFMGSRFN
jgi:uncharacterized protein YxjI